MKTTGLIAIIDRLVAFFDAQIDQFINQIKRNITIPTQSQWTKLYVHAVLSAVWFLIVCVCAVSWQDMCAFFDSRQWISGAIWTNSIIVITWKYVFFYPILLLNIWWLIPNLWQKKRYIRYFLSIPAMAFCLVLLKVGLHKIDPNLMPQSSNYLLLWFMETLNVLVVVIISSSIKYIYEDFAISAKTLFLERQKAQLELQNTELRVAQLKPHFLLNSLNNIDTLLLKKSDKAQYALQCLSDSLKYVLYDSSKPLLPLNDEITHLQNIVALECLRFSNPPTFSFTQSGDTTYIQIPPLLLTPLIENCFKWLDNQNRWIEVHIAVQFGRVEATFSNSYSPKAWADNKEKKGGLGLTRLRERLQMLYPKHHEKLLTINDQQPDRFTVIIKIPLV